MSRIRLGCTGWGYDDWRGGFYPAGTPAGEYLERYARVFSLAEVDSTYYRAPSRALAEGWARRTPSGFTFTPKFPGSITHDASLRGVEGLTASFLDALQPLRAAGKLGPLVLQLPASFTREKDADALGAFLADWPGGWPLAVELRHRSWWVPETYATLEAAGAALVWSVTESGRTPPVMTSDYVYTRLIGDRELTRFDRLQRDGTDEMRYWKEKLEDEGASAREVYALVNNHFLGFAPGAVVRLAEVLGLPRPDLAAAKRPVGQSSLFG